MAVRIMALSLAMTALSSAAVLQALTLRIKSRNLSDIMEYSLLSLELDDDDNRDRQTNKMDR